MKAVTSSSGDTAILRIRDSIPVSIGRFGKGFVLDSGA